MKRFTIILLIMVVVLASTTGYFGYRFATAPTGLQTLAGLSPAEAEVAGELMPVLAFSPEDVPGEVGGEAFIDDLGREVFIPGSSPVEKIVCLNPAATETLFYYGADDKLVAVSNAWLYWIETPEDVDSEIEGGVASGELIALDAFSVSPEAIIDLEPDVVFVFGYALPEYAAAIEDIVPVICFAPTSLEDILYDLVLIGKVVDEGEKAAILIDDIKARFVEIAMVTIDKPRPVVFCETGYWAGTIYTTGEGSFVASLIVLAGGDDIGTCVPSANPVISSEYILSSEPEVIILLDLPWVTVESVAQRPGWDTIPAVINGEVYELDAESVDRITRPGPRIAEGLEVLARIIHPELFE